MPDDSLAVIRADLQQLCAEIAHTEFRPAADEICARLTLLAARVDAQATTLLPKSKAELRSRDKSRKQR